jgi:rhodanese-related sulfurtransferase
MKHAPEFLKLVEDIMPQVREVSASEVKSLLDALEPFMLVDVREDHEWNAGHIAGAVHLGRGIIERDIEYTVPDKANKLVLYCGGGYRSALAAVNLQKMGYRNVFSMSGGWRSWKEKNYPVSGPVSGGA